MIEEIMTWGDLFAGSGGTTTGALAVQGVKVAWALNHSKEAIYTHELNHPETVHYHADIKDMDEHKLSHVDGLWASLECTNFSNAKGGLPREGDSRTLAWELPRYIIWCNPDYIIIENVREFLSWGPLDNVGKPISRDKGKDFIKWVDYIKNLGYPNYDKSILNSADYGAYTARKRLFLIFSKMGCEISFPKPLFEKKHYKACKEKINLEDTGQSIFGRKKPLAEKTLQRIAAGIRKFYPEMTHIMQYYSSGNQWSSINKPLGTITTKERHALVQFGVEYNGDSDAFSIDKPLRAITTKQKHAIASIENDKQFITKFYTGNVKSQNSSIDQPLHSITESSCFNYR
jgi:DNA (cytosine-5)-methyltransferase 1